MFRLRDYRREWSIGDSIWRLFFRRRIGTDDGATICWGMAYGDEEKIEIRLGQSSEERLATVIHELLHALDFHYGLGIDHAVIYKLEKPLARLIIDNYHGR